SASGDVLPPDGAGTPRAPSPTRPLPALDHGRTGSRAPTRWRGRPRRRWGSTSSGNGRPSTHRGRSGGERRASGTSERGRGGRADQDAGMVGFVAEAVGECAGELVSVSRPEDLRLVADGDGDLPFDHHAGLFTRVREHVLTSVRAGCVALVEDLERAVRIPDPDGPQRGGF